jgi:hypothetical protein
MKYFFHHDDTGYKEAFKSYYNKYKSRDLSISFDESPQENQVVLCEKNNAYKFENHNKIIFSQENNTNKNQIKSFQKMEEFYKCLLAQEFLRPEESKVKIYLFANAFGGSGSTTLSLNFAELLAEQEQVFYMSLDILPTYKYYLPQDQKYGFSEIIYKLKSNSELILDSHKNLDYFNACDYLEDMMLFNIELLEVLVENIKAAGYRRIIIDIGKRYEFVNLKDSVIFTVLGTSVLQYESISALNNLYKTNVYLINKRKLDTYISESHLKHIQQYFYVNYELDFKEGGFHWSSKAIQKILKGILDQL